MEYTKQGKTITLNEDVARKVIEVVSCGLVSGIGDPEPGKMCVEAAVNYACGFPHDDDPICVGFAVRRFKISLNDRKWSSNQARANGMKKIAVAQLGSDKLDQVDFSRKLALRTINVLLATFLDERGLKEHAHKCREAKTLDEAASAARGARKDLRAYAAAAAAAAADAAADAAAAAAYAAAAAAADAAADAAAADAAADARDRYLTMAADICLDVLIEMKSPGVQWLDLIPAP